MGRLLLSSLLALAFVSLGTIATAQTPQAPSGVFEHHSGGQCVGYYKFYDDGGWAFAANLDDLPESAPSGNTVEEGSTGNPPNWILKENGVHVHKVYPENVYCKRPFYSKDDNGDWELDGDLVFMEPQP